MKTYKQKIIIINHFWLRSFRGLLPPLLRLESGPNQRKELEGERVQPGGLRASSPLKLLQRNMALVLVRSSPVRSVFKGLGQNVSSGATETKSQMCFFFLP